ncbi:MAG: NAD-dependent epimerase/dehydratase family protein [Streptococcaceae bacterium]|jgi:UDP-glucose 4-epimerase|nr:NAD-dependent epimerase/dehydratase family protein [Streptococcaceae bacterium]
MIKNCKILITGGAGFIGSTLANTLLPNNKVVVLDDLSMGDFSNLTQSLNLIPIKGSLTDRKLLSELLSKNDFDYIFHLGAIASVADSIARPSETHEVNFESTLTLLELLRENHKTLKRFIFSSSAAVYGNQPDLPKSENSPICPMSPYAIDKFASEQMALIYQKLYGVPTSAVRFFNVFGPKQNPNSPYSGIISILVDKIKNFTDLTIFGDGEQARDFVYVEDVIQALLLVAICSESKGEVYNVGTGKLSTLNQIVKISSQITKREIPIIYTEERMGDIRMSLSDITKLETLGYVSEYDLESGLREYLEYELKK